MRFVVPVRTIHARPSPYGTSGQLTTTRAAPRRQSPAQHPIVGGRVLCRQSSPVIHGRAPAVAAALF
jgi:hypothetical protein